MRTLYTYRDLIAALPSIGLVALLVLGVQQMHSLKPKYDEAVKLEIIDIADVPPPPPEPVVPPPPAPPSPPVPRTPEPVPPRPQPVPVDTAAPVLPSLPPATPQPVDSKPMTEAKPVPQDAPPPVKPTEVPVPPPVPPAAKPNLDGEYIARVRAYLNSVKRYPTGREASLQRPQGMVKVWFVLKRDGTVVDAGIEESSNSTLLDDAARKTVNRAAFPPFPEQFKTGEATHRFTVELQFAPAG